MDRIFITGRHLGVGQIGPDGDGHAPEDFQDRSVRLRAALGLADSVDAHRSASAAEDVARPGTGRFRRAAARDAGMAAVAFVRLVPASATDGRSGLARLRRDVRSRTGEASGAGNERSLRAVAIDPPTIAHPD